MSQQVARCKECCYLAGCGVFVCEVGLPGGAYIDFDRIPPALLTLEAARQYRCSSLAMFDEVVRS